MFGPNDFQDQLDVPRGTLQKLTIYVQLLTKWQKQINLVGPKTIDDVWFRHIYDSAQMAPLIVDVLGDNQNRTILDLGAGAGFPSLVLSIMGVGVAHPVESVGKKCSFMRTVIRETKTPAEVFQGRIEDLKPQEMDIITSRALAVLDKLFDYALPFTGSNTEFWIMKGREWEEEVTIAKQKWNFDLECHKSKTDDEGMILRLQNVRLKS